MTKLLAPLLALLATAALAAGCGGSDDKGASSTTVKTDTAIASDPRVQAAIQRCKDEIDANDKASDEIKKEFKAICDQAVSGKPEELKKATRRVCDKIVDEATQDPKARAEGHKQCEMAATPPPAGIPGG
jgi:hypothetical protein